MSPSTLFKSKLQFDIKIIHNNTDNDDDYNDDNDIDDDEDDGMDYNNFDNRKKLKMFFKILALSRYPHIQQ